MTFLSKKDWLYRTIFYISFSLFIATFIFGTIYVEWVSITLSVMFLTLFAWFWFGTRYMIQGENLRITFGPIKYTININEIRAIRLLKNPSASAALAMERLEIDYGPANFIQISPEREQEFIDALQQVKPNIHIEKMR